MESVIWKKEKLERRNVAQLREQRETNTVLATFRKQSSFTLFTQRFLPPPSTARGGEKSCCRQFTKLFSGCTREAARAVRAREGVASTRRKHLAPYSPKSSGTRGEVALEVEKNRKRFHAFELPTREADDAEDRFGGGGIALRREAAVPLLPPSFVPLFSSRMLEMPNKRS